MRQQPEIRRQADGDEEQPKQQPFERLDAGLDLMPVSESANSTPARNAPSAIDSPALCK